MGFFSKVFKGIKKGFKKIGKGIKKGFAKFGKFMGKLGIMGQIAMMFIMPGIGGALMKGLGGIGQSLMTAMAGSGNIILQGAAKVMQGAANFVSKAGNVFRNVTEGVTNFVGEFSKTAANKLSSSFGFQKVPFADASSTFFTGGDSAWAKSTGKFTTRMTNLTASKDTIKALDAAAQSLRQSPIGAGTMTNKTTVGSGASTGTIAETSTGVTDSILANPDDNLSAFDLKENLMETAVTDLDIAQTQEFAMQDMVDQMTIDQDKSWFDKGKDLLSEGWDNAKVAARDEVTNFGSNTIKRIADAPVAGIEMGIKSGISNRIAGELNPQEEQYASSGAAQFQQVDVGGGQILQMPEANYGVNMSGSFGNAAVVDGYYSHMNSLSNVNNVGR
tara:strand:- start:7120 stop:8283 length:1164 start_codon:yes stop_codon:yes gene_type:complete